MHGRCDECAARVDEAQAVRGRDRGDVGERLHERHAVADLLEPVRGPERMVVRDLLGAVEDARGELEQGHVSHAEP